MTMMTSHMVGQAVKDVRLVLGAVFAVAALVRQLPAQRPVGDDTRLPRRVQLGASLAEVSDSLRAGGAPKGAQVVGVVPSSPAQSAGIQPGDIIVRIDRDTVRGVADALAALRPLAPDVMVPVSLLRQGRPTTIAFRTRERPREVSNEFSIEYRSVRAQGGRHRLLLARPNDGARHPALLLIGGIGCYSIDAPAGPNSYRDLAYQLTRHGYTTVRVEKLGVGDSEGGPCLGTDFETELDGYREALRAMAAFASVDASAIFLLGHSIGGIEAPLLAGDAGVPRVRGIAVLSTTGIAWFEYELANLRRQLRLQGLPADSVENDMRLKTSCGFRFLLRKESRESILASEPQCAPFIEYPAADKYMQAVADRPPDVAWKAVDASALIMHGASDFITSRAEHESLTEDINAMHPGIATFVEIPELDHYLSRQASQKASMTDPVTGLLRPYYGATLEPVLDHWLDSLSARQRTVARP